MNIMYVAFSYHPNQVPIMRGWKKTKNKAVFVTYTKGSTEDHTDCKPIVLGYSGLFQAADFIYRTLHEKMLKNSSFPEAFAGKFGFPSVRKVCRLLNQYKPDLVILRDRYLYSIFFYVICRRKGIKCILYNQKPYWEEEPEKKDILHRLVYKLTPRIRITPVLGKEKQGYVNGESYYVPFVIEPHIAPTQREYFKNQTITVLCVGKYEERKNQILLLEIIRDLHEQYPVKLLLVGEMSTDYHRRYYKKIKEYIRSHHMETYVECHTNCAPAEMGKFYGESDIFVLPSTGEFASISQLEAMSYSLPVIVSDTNGTACYIEEGVNGYLFRDNDKEQLRQQLSKLVSDQNKILEMGKMSYEKVVEQYSFRQYQTSIMNIYRQHSKVD